MFHRIGSLEQARRLADDPAVRSGYVAGGAAPVRATGIAAVAGLQTLPLRPLQLV
jgi:hypothetical protein